MQITVQGLIAIIGLTLVSAVGASPVARVTALASTVWLDQGDEKRRLTANDELSIGDRIITGDSGRAEIQLWSDPVLRIYPGTEFSFQAKEKSKVSPTDNPGVLYLQFGKICTRTGQPTKTGRDIVITVADKMIAVIHQSAHICLLRGVETSSVQLRDGSVEITSSIDQSILVLSEAGIEFTLNDDGSYQLLPPTDPGATAEETFIIETAETGTAVPDTAATNEAESKQQAGVYVYTLYLFSTRSEDVANQVNDRLQQAGHDSRILVDEKKSPIRFRIAVPGFDSRQAAEEYAASIVGTLGIRDTWIGRDRPGEAPTEKPPITETAETDTAVPDTAATNEAESKQQAGVYVYTLYLFSTRSEDVANRVNDRLQQAGHDSRILVDEKKPPIRFRIAVPGFDSRQAAEEYAASIVGTLGIKDTWIGRDRLSEAPTEKPLITETAETGTAAPDAAATNEAESKQQAGVYVYTLYLFSSRSEDVANRLNDRLQQAGHDSRILVDEKKSPIRFRIAVPGFESRQAAEEYAASIVGTLGIKDTWIGRDQPRKVD